MKKKRHKTRNLPKKYGFRFRRLPSIPEAATGNFLWNMTARGFWQAVWSWYLWIQRNGQMLRAAHWNLPAMKMDVRRR